MADKNIYVVRGSEDGNLGAFGSRPAAVACALTYVAGDGDRVAKHTSQHYVQTLFEKNWVEVELAGEYNPGNGYAEIETFILNK